MDSLWNAYVTWQEHTVKISEVTDYFNFKEREIMSKTLNKYIASFDYFDKLKTTRNKKKKHNKIIMLARSKLNSMGSKGSEVLTKNEYSHEDFITIFNEEKCYRKLKESFRMMNTQRSDTEKNFWLKKLKEIWIDKIIKQNEIINKIFSNKSLKQCHLKKKTT